MEEYEACNQPLGTSSTNSCVRSLKVALSWLKVAKLLQTLLPNSGAEKVPVCAQAGSL